MAAPTAVLAASKLEDHHHNKAREEEGGGEGGRGEEESESEIERIIEYVRTYVETRGGNDQTTYVRMLPDVAIVGEGEEGEGGLVGWRTYVVKCIPDIVKCTTDTAKCAAGTVKCTTDRVKCTADTVK